MQKAVEQILTDNSSVSAEGTRRHREGVRQQKTGECSASLFFEEALLQSVSNVVSDLSLTRTWKASPDKLDPKDFRITSMSSIEVSLLAPNYKMESDAGRTIRRNQRPSPSPPSLDPPPSSTPLPTTREKPLYPTRMTNEPCLSPLADHDRSPLVEISSSPIEAPDESIRNTERPYPLLL